MASHAHAITSSPACLLPVQPTDSNKTKARSASLTMSQAIGEYCFEARWTVCLAMVFFFLASQTSRQVRAKLAAAAACLCFVHSDGVPNRLLSFIPPLLAPQQSVLTPCCPCPARPMQMADYYIRWWTRDWYGKYKPACQGDCGPMFYVKYYAILGLGLFIGLMFFRGAFLYLWTLGAGERIRQKSIHRLLYAPLGFFLMVGTGQALNAGHAPVSSLAMWVHKGRGEGAVTPADHGG